MARTSRVVLNRQAFDEINLGIADGLFAVAKQIVSTARPPDAEPFGTGLVTSGGAAAWINTRKVDNESGDGAQVSRPRGLKLRKGEVTAIAGFGFPGRFQELGTVQHGAQPFLTPAAMAVVPSAAGVIAEASKRRLKRRK